MKWPAAVLLGIALPVLFVACAPPAPPGAYTMTAALTAGSCPDNRQAPRTVLVDTSNTLRFLGVPGGCPLELVNDSWIGKCDLGGGAVSILWRLTFTDAGFWGETSEVYFTPTGYCFGEYAVTGVRQ